MGTKIATQLIDPVTGERYYIGTVGAVENVAVKLSAPTSEDWASMKVVVQDITDGANNGEYQLNALGEAKFFVPMGHIYQITLPTLDGFNQPTTMTITAQLASRTIAYEYTKNDILYEQLNISAKVINGDANLDGLIVVVLFDNGESSAAEFANGICTLRIPYGQHYKVQLPSIEGYFRDGLNVQFTAGLPSRFISVTYSDIIIGFFGIDDNGNKYNQQQIEAMTQEERSVIHYIGYNDSELNEADRGDGTTGCGFCFSINCKKELRSYLSENVELDRDRLPFYATKDDAIKDFKNAYNTATISSIVKELSLSSEACEYCQSKSIVYGGVERIGNFISAGCLEKLALNSTSLSYICNLLNINLNDYFQFDSFSNSSTQCSETINWKYYNSCYSSPSYPKTHKSFVTPVFDL